MGAATGKYRTVHRAGYYSRVGSGATVIKDDLGGSFGDGVNLKRRKRRKRKKKKERCVRVGELLEMAD